MDPPWHFPDPRSADEDGVVGVGADLEPATLVHAYRSGIFPWPHPGTPLPWFSPDPRGVLTAGTLHISRSLGRHLRTCGWTTTVDRAFGRVIDACARPRDGRGGTWITREMRRGYRRLHQLGWAHSIEVWSGTELVGGLYGVQVGGCFTGESMYHEVSEASKVALVDLVRRFTEAGGALVDVQITTPHLESMGARERERERFLRTLERVRSDDVRLALDARPARRLAPPGGR